jgi:hypothetical protein
MIAARSQILRRYDGEPFDAPGKRQRVKIAVASD